MRILWAALLLAVVSRAARAEPAALAKIDEALAAAKGAQSGLARCLESREASAVKPAKPALSAATAAACSGSCAADTAAADPAFVEQFFADVELRQICLAVAGGAEKPCEVLSDEKGDPESPRHLCRRLYAMSVFSKKLFSDPAGSGAACGAWCALAPTPPPGALVGKVCAALGKRDYLQACSDIENFKTTPDHGYNVRECHWEMQSLLGEGGEESCRRHYRPGSDVCAATALYRKSLAASNAKLCGTDPLCRARGGGRAACAPLDAEIEKQARGAARKSGVAERPEAAGLAPERVDRVNRDCARARAFALRRLDEAARSFTVEAGAGPPLNERRKALAELQSGLKNADEKFLLRSGIGSSHRSAAARASYAGTWKFYRTPTKATGACEESGRLVGQEAEGGPVEVDASGRFLFFAGSLSLAGAVNVQTGKVDALLADPNCGEGFLTGNCANPQSCSGAYSLSGIPGPDGAVNSDAGVFRLAR